MNKKASIMTEVKSQDPRGNQASNVSNGKSKFIRYRNNRIKNRRNATSENSVNQPTTLLNIP